MQQLADDVDVAWPHAPRAAKQPARIIKIAAQCALEGEFELLVARHRRPPRRKNKCDQLLGSGRLRHDRHPSGLGP